jgi:ketosteroid isomerase-like protein
MLTKDEAYGLAQHWIQAWNSHDIDAILSHYSEDVVLVSPVAAKLLGDPAGTVKGKASLRAYFQKGLEFYPQLKFNLIDVMWGLSSLVLYYTNQNSTKSGEFMEIKDGKITRVVANYGG